MNEIEEDEIMSKIAFCVCSNSGIDYFDFPKDIQVLRSIISYNETEHYKDYIELTAEAFYTRLLENANEIPKTAFIPMGVLESIIDDYEQQGYTDVIINVISAKLSGLYNAINLMSELSERNIKIHAVDSKSLVYPQVHMTLTGYDMANKGHSVQEIIAEMEKIRDNSNILFTVDTLAFLEKNGRLSKAAASIGNMIKLRPLFKLDSEGSIEVVEKIRTTSKAQKRMLDLYVEQTKNLDIAVTYVAHANNDEDAIKMKESIKEIFPDREVIIMYITPVVGAHTGPGAVGLGYISK